MVAPFIGELAALAIGWLRRSKAVRRIKVKGWVQDLIKLEEGPGANTAAWKRLRDDPPGEITMTAEERAYLVGFKDAFDQHFKRPLKIAHELFGDDEE